MAVRVVVAGCLVLAGCFSSGHIRYRDNPELARVTLYDGGEPTTPNLGVVEAEASGYESCDALAANVMQQLLGEARAMGGSGVADVKFRARWHWTGHVLCRRGFGHTVKARGVAVR